MKPVEIAIIVIVALIVLAVVIAAIIRKLKGKPSISSGCCGCPYAKGCDSCGSGCHGEGNKSDGSDWSGQKVASESDNPEKFDNQAQY